MKRKKEKKTIKKIFPSYPEGVLRIQEYFEEMSAKGYMITGFYGIFYEFEKCEPKKRRFYIDYFYKASIFDSKPENKTKDYIDYCKSAGWNHCFSNGKMQCFYTEDMESPEIETDDELRFKSIAKESFLTHMIQYFLTIMYMPIGMSQMTAILNRYYMWESFVTSSFSLIMYSFVIIYFMMSLGSFIRFLQFYIKNKVRLKHGEKLYLASPDKVKKGIRNRMIEFGLLFFGILLLSLQGIHIFAVNLTVMIIIIASLFIIGIFMKSKLSNRENNIAMIIVMTVIMLLITTFSIVGVLAGIVVYDMGKYTEEKYIMTMNQMPALLKDLGYELEGENNKEESIRVDEAKTFIANSVCYSSHLYYRDESNAILDNRERTPFYEMTVFNSRIKGIREKYIDLFLINEDTKPLSKEKYSSLVKRGYEGYIAEKNGIIRLMIYKDREVIVIRSHEEFTEENVLKLLEG